MPSYLIPMFNKFNSNYSSGFTVIVLIMLAYCTCTYNQILILAYLDEQCEIASGCQMTINSGEPSSVVPTCQSGVCSCSAGSSQFDRLIGTCNKLCLSK